MHKCAYVAQETATKYWTAAKLDLVLEDGVACSK